MHITQHLLYPVLSAEAGSAARAGKPDIAGRRAAVRHRGVGAAVDRLIGCAVGEIGRARAGSDDTAMHLELGTLSSMHVRTANMQAAAPSRREAEPGMRLPAGRLSNA